MSHPYIRMARLKLIILLLRILEYQNIPFIIHVVSISQIRVPTILSKK